MELSENLLKKVKSAYQDYLLESLMLDIDSKIDFRTKTFEKFVEDYLAKSRGM